MIRSKSVLSLAVGLVFVLTGVLSDKNERNTKLTQLRNLALSSSNYIVELDSKTYK